ncbi:MAG TPA: DsbA family protein [Alphaproteobacteria bacterium]|nr:DsbA family protein [Alphaproteobacteria bacterium]
MFKSDRPFKRENMMFQTLKTFLPAAMLTAALSFAAAPPAAAAEEGMTKEAVQKIVHDYIMENPDVILDAVNKYQQRTMEEKQKAAVETNREYLFRDERSPVIGNPDGDVTIVEFFDYNCGYCKRVLPTVQDLIKEDKGLKVIFKDVPILGPSSETASKWALAAQRHNKYFEFHQALMNHKGPITDDTLAKIATDLELDPARLKKDAETTDVLLQIERNRSLFTQMGLGGTPAFIIGEEVVPGAIGKDDMKKLIEKTRAKAKGDKKDK